MRCVRLDLTRHEIACHNACSASVNRDDVKKLCAIKQTHSPEANLASELLICTQEQLLSGLAASVERTTDLGTSK